ncbi:MAG: hypothetical protein JWN44_5133 [Myxococcales bacterium]|nr:hypothetical protein [Myxococcales bacterium]
MRWKRMALGVATVGFGLMVGAGGMFEVVNLLRPALFASLQDDPIMRLHHTEPVVFWWTLLSNFGGIAAGAAFAATGVGVVRRRVWARRLGRAAARGFWVICAGGALVCAVYLVPALVRGLGDPARRAESLVFLISLGCSTVMMPACAGGVYWGLGRGE